MSEVSKYAYFHMALGVGAGLFVAGMYNGQTNVTFAGLLVYVSCVVYRLHRGPWNV